MAKETLLMQYQSECLSALKSVVNIHKPFEKAFMDTMKLFMAIPDRISFLQLGRYGCFSEQTYRNLFENETFDWFVFNASTTSKHLTGKRKAIAIAPSYIPKSGHKTPWIGYFRSGCAGDYKRGLEIMGIGVIDIDNHECMTSGSIQTPDGKTLDNMGKKLFDWYSSYLISRKDKLQSISKTLVADAFFSKETFITPMCENDFHVISRFRNDVVLDYYRTRFQLEFCFRDGKQHAGITNCQSTDFRKLDFHFNASLAAVNLAKAACKRLGIAYSISYCKSFIHNAYMLERFICVFGINPDMQVIDKLFKELILFTARAA